MTGIEKSSKAKCFEIWRLKELTNVELQIFKAIPFQVWAAAFFFLACALHAEPGDSLLLS